MTKKIFILFLSALIGMSYSIAQTADNTSEAQKYNAIGYSLMQKGDLKSAISYFDKAIAQDSLNVMYFKNRAYSRSMLNDYNGALNDYVALSKLLPGDPGFYFEIGNLFNKLEKFNDAVNNYSKSIQLSKPTQSIDDYFLCYYNRGVSKLTVKKYQSALFDFDTVIASEPYHLASYCNRGIAKYYLKQNEKACYDWVYAYNLGYKEANSYLQKYCKNFEKIIKIVKKDDSKGDSAKTAPIFIGGQAKLNKFLTVTVKNPQSVNHNFETGRVIVRFTVFSSGNVGDYQILNSVSPIMDIEAMRIIQSTKGKWYPGIVSNEPVDVSITLSVIFKTTVNENIDKIKEKGYANLGKDNYLEAIKCFDMVIKHEPANKEILEKRAQVKEKINDKEGAVSDRQKINLDLNPIFKSNPKKTNSTVPDTSINYVVIYYDSIWQLTKKTSAKYYRFAKWNSNLHYFEGDFIDYDLNQRMIAQGTYSSKMKDGNYRLYYPNGYVKCSSYYKSNEPFGVWNYFYENGKKWQTIEFKDKDFKVLEYYNPDGSALINNSTGKWQWLVESFDKNNDMMINGTFLSGSKVDTWDFKKGGQLILEETYKKGKFSKGKSYEGLSPQKTKKSNISNNIFIPDFLLQSEKFIFSKDITTNDYSFIIRNDH